jgi:hypothetical protein
MRRSLIEQANMTLALQKERSAALSVQARKWKDRNRHTPSFRQLEGLSAGDALTGGLTVIAPRLCQHCFFFRFKR